MTRIVRRGQFQRIGDSVQIAAHESNVSGLHRNVGAGLPIAIPTSACAKRRRVIDAVAHHSHSFSLRFAACALQPPCRLAVPKQARVERPTSRATASAVGKIIASDHPDFDVHRL